MDGIYLTRAELEALENAEGVLVKGYLWLRSRMDLRTGLVGLMSGISYSAVAEHCEYEVRKGKGVQRFTLGSTPLAVKECGRRVCERLEKLGLLVSKGGELLCFLCPLAKIASVRPKQTGHERATPLSTERDTGMDTHKASNGAGFEGFDGVFCDERDAPKNEANAENGPHIRDQGVYTSQSSSTPDNEEALGDAGGAGVNRDRAAPSQAGSACGRPGETHADPYRDRPAGSHVGPQGADSGEGYRVRPAASHPAQPRRLAAGPDAGGARQPGLWPTNARSSAEKERFADGMASSDAIAPLLRAVLDARGIRSAGADLLLRSWLDDGVSPDELAEAVEKARQARIKADSTQPIPLSYVAKVLSSQRAAAARAVEQLEGRSARKWRGGLGDLGALAVQLGVSGARPGESNADFRARVLAAYNARKGADGGAA